MEISVGERWEQSLWNLIYAYVKHGLEVVCQYTLNVLCWIRAFYDNLCETLKESLAHARRKLEETWNYIKELSVSASKSCANMFRQLLHLCARFLTYVKSIFSKSEEASEATRKRYTSDKCSSAEALGWLSYVTKLLKFIIRPWEYRWNANERTLLVRLLKYMLTNLESRSTGKWKAFVRLLKLILENVGPKFIGENGSIFTARFHF